MVNNFIITVTKLSLHWKAEDLLSARNYKEAEQWLSQWSIENNIPRFIIDNEEEGVTKARMYIKDEILYHRSHLNPESFEFTIQIGQIENNSFWLGGYSRTYKMVENGDD